jgi:hypothetical protein
LENPNEEKKPSPVSKPSEADKRVHWRSRKERPAYLKDLPLVFMGEIKNMPEHGVFVGMKTGKVYSGYHIFNFEEIPGDET